LVLVLFACALGEFYLSLFPQLRKSASGQEHLRALTRYRAADRTTLSTDHSILV
jgi:hypothetical protein